MDRTIGMLTLGGTELSLWRLREPTKVWLTFRPGAILPSPLATMVRGKGVEMKSGSECSVFCERGGESCFHCRVGIAVDWTIANQGRFGLGRWETRRG